MNPEVGYNSEEQRKENLQSIKEKSFNINEPIKESKYKKRKKEDEEKKQEQIQTISGIGSILMSVLVERLPRPKPLSETEKKQIDSAFDRVAEKYIEVFGQYQEEFALIMVVGMIVLPRVEIFKKKDEPGKNE